MKGGFSRGASGGREAVLRLWDLVTLYPEVSDTELEERIDHFIMNGGEEELLAMARALFDFFSPLILEDERLRRLMASLEGKRLGLFIDEDYYSVVTFRNDGFRVELERDDHIPAMGAVNREVYRDAVLKRRDPMRLFLERKIKVRGLARIIRWGIPYMRVLRSRDLYDRYLARQPEVEAKLEETLTRLGY